MDMGKFTNVLTSEAYHAVCLLFAVGLTSWCIHEFNLDHDVTEIKLKKYHETEEDIYPSITMCYTRPFIKRNYMKYIENLTTGEFQDIQTNDDEPIIIRQYIQWLEGNKMKFHYGDNTSEIVFKENWETFEGGPNHLR